MRGSRVEVDRCKIGLYKGHYMPHSFICGIHGEVGFVQVDDTSWMCVKCREAAEVIRNREDVPEESLTAPSLEQEIVAFRERRNYAIA